MGVDITTQGLSLAGVRRACPALKPDAADQVLLKNRAGFAAFSKGRAFHRCLEQDRCAGDREAGSHPAGSAARAERPYSVDGLTVVAMPVAQDVSPRLIPLVVSLIPRMLLGFSHYCGVSDPAHGGGAIRAGRTPRAVRPYSGGGGGAGRASRGMGHAGHTGVGVQPSAVGAYGSSRRGLRRDMPGGAYHF